MLDTATTVPSLSKANQYLSFHSGGEIFALPITPIREIIQFQELTEIPLMPAFIRGVINLRGTVVPLIDLAVRFGRTPTSIGRKTCAVIVELADEPQLHQVGLLVESVNEVLDLVDDQIEPAPALGAHIRTDFIAGMGKTSHGFLVILSMDQILAMTEIAQLISTAVHQAAPQA